MEYSERVKKVLNNWANEAAAIGDSYLKVNIDGLGDVSVNAHELNAFVAQLKVKGGFHNKGLHKAIAMTCARIVAAFERIEEESIAEEAAHQKIDDAPISTKNKKKGE